MANLYVFECVKCLKKFQLMLGPAMMDITKTDEDLEEKDEKEIELLVKVAQSHARKCDGDFKLTSTGYAD